MISLEVGALCGIPNNTNSRPLLESLKCDIKGDAWVHVPSIALNLNPAAQPRAKEVAKKMTVKKVRGGT